MLSVIAQQTRFIKTDEPYN